MIIKASNFCLVECWCRSSPRYLSAWLSRVRCDSFGMHWSESWSKFWTRSESWSESGYHSKSWSTNI